jgi:CSLREA domain-containing protein
MTGRVVVAMRAAVLALGLAWVPVARAAVFTVNSTADEVDASPGNGACATADGACTLRAAIQEANALAGNDMIVLPAGVFRLTLVGAGEDAAATGDLDILQSVDVSGAGPDATIIDGLGADRVFHVLGSSTLTLSNLTVRNGDATGSAGGGVFLIGPAPLMLSNVNFEDNHADTGGAVMVANGEVTVSGSTFERNISGAGAGIFKAGTGFLTIAGSTFSENHSTGAGGAVYYGSMPAASVSDSQFTGNTSAVGGALFLGGPTGFTLSGSHFDSSSSTGPGGAVYYGGTGPVSVDTSTFTGGASNGPGGGAFISTDGPLTVSASEFSDNSAAGPGGGLYASLTSGAITVTDTPFRRNAVLTGPGGGLFTTTTGALVLSNVEASDNAAGGPGGGVFASGNASVAVSAAHVVGNSAIGGPGGGMFESAVVGDTTIDGSTFDGNAAFGSLAGGLYVSQGGVLTLRGSTFSANQATGVASLGGGIYNSSAAGSTVVNSTFSGNLAGNQGGAFYAVSQVAFTNVTFSDNGAPGAGGAVFNGGGGVTLVSTILARSTAGGQCGGGAFTSGGNNLDDGSSCALAGPRDQSGLDALLGPLQDNGGPTLTHALLPGSPAIDAGNGPACPPSDQRGVTRPTDGNGDGVAACDVGAYEFVDACPGDPNKVEPGVCGCGVPDVDANGNGVIDCLINAELKARIASGEAMLDTFTGGKSQKVLKADIKAAADDIMAYVTQFKASLVLADAHVDLTKLSKRARKAVRAALGKRGHALNKARARALAALTRLDQAVAPQ